MYFDALAMLVDGARSRGQASSGSAGHRLIVAASGRRVPGVSGTPLPIARSLSRDRVDDWRTDACTVRVRGNPACSGPSGSAGLTSSSSLRTRGPGFDTIRTTVETFRFASWQVGETFCEHLGLVDAISMIQGWRSGNLVVAQVRVRTSLLARWNAWGDGWSRRRSRPWKASQEFGTPLSRFGRRSRNFGS
jgi:hypothetical protein